MELDILTEQAANDAVAAHLSFEEETLDAELEAEGEVEREVEGEVEREVDGEEETEWVSQLILQPSASSGNFPNFIAFTKEVILY